ncbi:MAG: branched-chain amino acid ABC transporter permease [SAR324 cluster bacterium]|nr:branched-chain amino acid ABC transporter permease [SAR324 cluster bacterium]
MRFIKNRRTLITGASFLFFLLLPLIASALGDAYLVTLFTRILIYALAAVSLDLILGYGGMNSLGHTAFFGTGAYVVGILAFHIQEETLFLSWPIELSGSSNAILVWLLAVLFSAFMSGLIGALSLRTTGIQFIMITLAFAQMLYYLFVSLEAYGGDDGISLWARNKLPIFDTADDTSFYYLCLGFLVIFVFLSYRLVHSHFGRVIRGAKQNLQRMQSLGFPIYRYQLVCFIIAGAGAGLAGALMANQSEFVSPGLLHWTHSGEMMIMVLLGGMGTLIGPILGATALLLLEEFLSVYTEHWMAFLGPFLIIVVLFAKRGLYGLLTGKEVNDE